MAVTAQETIFDYTANGGATQYSLGCRVLDAEDVVVTVDGAELALNVDYTVTNVGGAAGSTVVFAVPPPAGAAVRLYRQTRATRETDYQTAGDFQAAAVNADFDRAMMAIQDLENGSSAVRNALRGPAGEALPELPDAVTRAGRLLGFDGGGDPVALVQPDAAGATALDLALRNVGLSTQGAGQIGYSPDLDYSPGTVGGRLAMDAPCVLEVIPESLHLGILFGTSNIDVSSYINDGFEIHPVMRMPRGFAALFTRYPLNLSARRSATAFQARALIGSGSGLSIINGYTGNFPVIDATGNSGGGVYGINVRSDNSSWTGSAADCASIGLFCGRGAIATQSNAFHVVDFRFNGHSDMTRNGGAGTFGIINHGCEHVIRNGFELYANVPLFDGTALPFTVSRSSTIPGIGADFEQGGSGGSCTIHENRNGVLVSIDTLRHWWCYQVGNVDFSNLYTSSRFRFLSTPAYSESFFFDGAASNVRIQCYQEESGLFGSTYRQHGRYLTFGGGGAVYEGLQIDIVRGALDQGFGLPGAASSSIHFADGATLANSRLSCNYLISTYSASGDNNGFAAMPVSWAGTTVLRNVELVLDHSTAGRSANIFTTGLGAFCTNVRSTNWRNGKSMRCDATNLWTPAVVGVSSAGVGTYSFRTGEFEREGQWLKFSGTIIQTGHTGTGYMRINGLPFVSNPNANQAVQIYADGLTVGAGYQLQARVPAGQSFIELRRFLASDGTADGVPMDSSFLEITVTGCIRLSDAL